MGVEVFNSILNYDYTMIITVFTLSGFLTMIGQAQVFVTVYALGKPKTMNMFDDKKETNAAS